MSGYLESYCRSPRELSEIEQDLSVEVAKETDKSFGMVLLDSPSTDGYFGAIGRSLEVQRGFGEMPEDMDGLEHTSKFIYTYDYLDGTFRVTHSMRYLEPLAERPLEVVQSLLGDLEGQVTLEEVAEYHAIDNPGLCLYVTTDLSVPGILPTRSKPYGLLTYKALFERAKEGGFSHVLAYMNSNTIRCMGRLAIHPELLCGRDNYTIPPVAGLTFEAYQPYVVPTDLPEARVFDDSEYAARVSRWGRQILALTLPCISVEDVTR
ncbi:MAG TPA: hypothetical protein VJ841_05555 [Candidatus Saccharimonadales bacterium]|nr:hypothetical protein [Candidatus Saccharimonadales bacterium]